ncbi:MAG: AAA family ATPase, partial [Gammaproteobacteria bacterium]
SAAEASTQTPERITALRDQASRLLAAAQHVEDKKATRQQVTVLALWREILDRPLHLTALFVSSQAGASPGDDVPVVQPADERHRALLQARLRHAASLLRANLQQDRRIPYTTGGAIGLGQDLWREAREIPLHLAMPILAGAMQLVAGEQNGWHPLIPGLWNALLFGFSVWVALQLGRRSTRLMARAHDFIIRRIPGRSRLDWLGNLLRILTPFAPWLLAWLVIDGVLHIADIDTGIVAQWLAPLARLYILFHLIRLLIDSAGRLLATADGSYLHDQGRLANDARRSALLVTVLLFLQGVAAGNAGAALIDSLLEPVFWAAAWLAFGWPLRHSGNLAVPATARHLDALGFSLPGADMIGKLLARRQGWLLMPAAALVTLLTATARVVHEELLHFDAYRRLVLRSVRLRIAAEEVAPTAHHRNEVPADYRRLFQGRIAEAPDIPVNDDLRKRIQSMVDEWAGDRRDENSVAIIGDPGSGKGFLLDALHVPDGVRVCQLSPGKRLQTKEQFIAALANALEENLPDGLDSLLAQDAQRTPTLLILDDAHRLFLTRVGGLDAWRALLAAINLPLDNIFWCVTLGTQPWIYLSDVFGSRYQFREVLRLRRWGMDDIRSLILTRHARSDYALRFEDVLLGAHALETSANLQSVEQRFFGLLWDSSRGNPGLALVLWQKTIALAAKNTLVAGTPPSPFFSPAGFSDSGLFVLATIARHGAISSTEIVQATDLKPAAVSHALKIGLDDDVLVQQDGLYALQLETYYPLVSYLTAKNLLHE